MKDYINIIITSIFTSVGVFLLQKFISDNLPSFHWRNLIRGYKIISIATVSRYSKVRVAISSAISSRYNKISLSISNSSIKLYNRTKQIAFAGLVAFVVKFKLYPKGLEKVILLIVGLFIVAVIVDEVSKEQKRIKA